MKKSILLLLNFCFILQLSAQQAHPSKAYLGINSNSVSKEKAKALGFENSNGAYVTKVIENTTAEKSGIQPFDYLVGINDQPFKDHNGFHNAMQNYSAGDQASVQLIRDGEKLSIPLVFGKQREAIYRKIPKEEEPFFGVKQDHYNWKEKGPGVKVSIVDNSAAEAAGLQDNDVITSINAKKIVDWHDLSTAVDNMNPGDPITLIYLRDNQRMTGSTIIKSYGATYKMHEEKEVEENEEVSEKEIPQILADLEIEVDMEDVTQEEADDMKEKVGVDMPIINDLQIERLNIFPNPNDGVFNLTFDLPNEGKTTIRIFTSTGRLVYQNDMQQFSGLYKDRIDISNNTKGIYFLEVNQEGKSITQKVIFQ